MLALLWDLCYDGENGASDIGVLFFRLNVLPVWKGLFYEQRSEAENKRYLYLVGTDPVDFFENHT